MFRSIQDLSEDLQEKVKKIITKEGYTQCDLKITDLNTGGDNFLGNLYEIDIKGVTENGKKETNLFVKAIIKLEKINLMSVEDVYSNEVFIYNDLSKIFTILQNEAEVPIKERYYIAKSFDGTDSNLIILENLHRKGFKTYNRFDVMPLKFAELAIQQLAKFHGMSFVMEKKMPVFYNNRIKTLKHPLNYDDDFEAMAINCCKYTANLFKNDKKKRLQKFISTTFEKFCKYNYDNTSIKCCLSHGDYKVGNILVRESLSWSLFTIIIVVLFKFILIPSVSNSFGFLKIELRAWWNYVMICQQQFSERAAIGGGFTYAALSGTKNFYLVKIVSVLSKRLAAKVSQLKLEEKRVVEPSQHDTDTSENMLVGHLLALMKPEIPSSSKNGGINFSWDARRIWGGQSNAFCVKTRAPRWTQSNLNAVNHHLEPAPTSLFFFYCYLNSIPIVPKEGEAVEVVPVDYQLIDYGCPIRDFLFLIFTATDQEFRRKHLQDLKEMYFETLSQFLKYFNIDVEDVYPRKEYERVYQEWLDFGLIKVMYSVVFLYASEKGLDVDKLSLSELPFEPCSEFEERARGWVDDFMEWGYL